MPICCRGVWFASQYLVNTHVGCHVDMCSCRGEGDECRTLLPSRHIKALCRKFRRKYGPWYRRKFVTKEGIFFLASLTLLYNRMIKYPQDRTADWIVWVAVVYACGKHTWSPFLLTSYFSIYTNETIRKSH